MSCLGNFWSDESGATAIEYALIAGLLSIALVAAASLVGTELKSTFTHVETGLKKRTTVS